MTQRKNSVHKHLEESITAAWSTSLLQPIIAFHLVATLVSPEHGKKDNFFVKKQVDLKKRFHYSLFHEHCQGLLFARCGIDLSPLPFVSARAPALNMHEIVSDCSYVAFSFTFF